MKITKGFFSFIRACSNAFGCGSLLVILVLFIALLSAGLALIVSAIEDGSLIRTILGVFVSACGFIIGFWIFYNSYLESKDWK